jgi:hypothetical protein
MGYCSDCSVVRIGCIVRNMRSRLGLIMDDQQACMAGSLCGNDGRRLHRR